MSSFKTVLLLLSTIVLGSVLLSSSLVSAQCASPYTWDSGEAANNHTYCAIGVGSIYSWYEALNYLAALPKYFGKQPYLATVTSEEELKFLTSKFPSLVNCYVGVDRDIFNQLRYSSGPERGEVMYDYPTGVNQMYNNFQAHIPGGDPNQKVAFFFTSNNFFMGLPPYSSTSNCYLLEYSEATDPYVAPMPSEGGDVTIKFLDNFVVEDVNIIVNPFGGAPVSCEIVSRDPQYKTLVFKMPAMTGIGVNFILVDDGFTTFNITYWKYKAPAIQSVYPTRKGNGELITIVGNNFGADKTAISVTTGYLYHPCLYIDIVEPHYAISCQTNHPVTSSTNLFPLTIRVGQSSNITSYRAAFYDDENVKMIRLNYYAMSAVIINNSVTAQKEVLFEGHTPYMGLYETKLQYDLIRSTWAWQSFPSATFMAGGIGNQTSFIIRNGGGPRDGERVTNGTTCLTGIYCPMGTFDGTLIANYNTMLGRLSYQAFSSAGELVYYGDTPYIEPQELTIDAAGGLIIVPLARGTVGFKYTKRSYAIDGMTTSYPIKVLNNRTLGLTIPAGISLSFNLSITIEKYVFSGLRVNYTTPSVLSIPPVSTMGGFVTVYGYAFGNDEKKISITIDAVPCPNVVLLANETILSCLAPPGVGANKTMLITIDNVVQNVSFSYKSPAATEVVQNGTSIAIYGSNFGNALTTPQVFVPYPVAVNFTYDTLVQSLNATVPVYAQNGKIFIQAGNQMGSINYVYRPQFATITPITSTEGNTVTISGMFLTQYRTDGMQTNFRVVIGGRTCAQPEFSYNVNGTYVTCTAPAGSGLANDAYITVDGQTSNYQSINYPAPSISSFTQNGQILTIYGANFGPDLDRIKLNLNGNPLACQSVATKPSRLICSIPSITKNGNISVTVQGQTSNVVELTLLPSIIRVTSQTIYGGLITFTGTFFNILNWQGNQTNLDITIGGAPCTSPQVTYSNTYITCNVAAGTGIKPLNFTLGPNTIMTTFQYIAPRLQVYEWKNNQITLNGTNIGTDMDKISIYIYQDIPGNVATLIPFNATGDMYYQSIIADTPVDMLNGVIYISVDNLASNQLYVRLIPQIDSVVGVFPTAGATTITIYGDHFNNKNGAGAFVQNYILIGETFCNNVVFYNRTCMTCVAGIGSGLNKRGFAMIDSTVSNNFYVNYTAANVTKIVQTNMLLELTGTNFGNKPYLNVLAFGPLVNSTASYTTQVLSRVTVSPFSQNGNISFIVDGQSSNLFPWKFTPIITSVSSVDYAGGNITVMGYFFNGTTVDGNSTSPKIYIGTKGQCANLTYLANDVVNNAAVIVCSAPPGSAADIDIPFNVEIDGVNGTTKFTYGAPQLNSYTITQNNQITLKGYQFGVDPAKVQVYFGTVLMAIQSITDSEITFTATAALYNENVYVRSVTNAKTTNPLFVTLYPVIRTSTAAPTTGGRSTITGSWLNQRSGNYSTSIRVWVNGSSGSVNSIVQTNNLQFLINAPAGTGLNKNLTVSFDGMSSSLLTFSYLPPTIFNTIQSGTTLTFNGTNYGRDLANVYTTPFTALSGVSDLLLSVTLAKDTKSGMYNVQVDGQTSANYMVYLTPIISQVIPAPTTGPSDITIKGTFLNQFRVDGSLTNASVWLNNVSCPITSFVSNTLITATVPLGLYRKGNLTVAIDGKVAITKYDSLGPEVYTVTNPPIYQVAQVVTITGKNFFDPLVVYIGDSECTVAIAITENSLYCSFDSTVQPTLALIPVSVISTGLIGTANIFSYADLTCQNNCNGHGTCLNGICSCDVGFGGALCHTAVNLTVPVPSTSEFGGSVTTDQTTYNVGVQFIREIDAFGVTVKVYEASKMYWILAGKAEYDTYTVNTYTASFASSGEQAKITIKTYEFEYGALFEFGGEKLPESSHSFKHQVAIDHYGFVTTGNSLQVIYSASTPTTYADGCASAQTAYTLFYSSQTGSVLAYDFETKYSVFTARFSTRILVDYSVQTIEINPLAKSDPLWSTQNGLLESKIVINVPSFSYNVEFDPNFSAYVKGINPTCVNPTTTSVTTVTPTTVTPTTVTPTTSTPTTVDPTTSQTTQTATPTTSTPTTSTPTSATTASSDPTTSNPTTATPTTSNPTTSNPTTGQTSIATTVAPSSSTNPSSTGPIVTCPGTPVCSGRGTCVGQLGVYHCVCQGNWQGSDCSAEPGKIPPPTDPSTDNPNTNQTDTESGVKLDINVISIREVDFMDQIIGEYKFGKNWTFNETKTDQQLIYLYQTDVVREGKITTHINVTVQYFYYETNITFAGQTSTMSPGSIKYSVSLSKFDFESGNNGLQVLFSSVASASTSSDDACSLKQFEYGDNSKDLTAISLQINGRTLYGKFTKFALADGKIVRSTNEVISKDQPTDSNSIVQAVVAIGVGNYGTSAVIDPDFHLLISSDASEKEGSNCSGSSSKLSNGALAGIVVGSVAGAAVLVAAGISAKKWRQLKKDQSITDSKLKRMNAY
ncbi:hypothetical protein DFA_06495 [Cavenderia fasciculata]|uniref:EGF-like domain-containing protein n=1 Tax=Cavenderia fasciculata TaxID=261658 RepID=F4PJ59_CACFS|nr:uncharacterized protein DFA_06495 [Cavenderia fasciculata]EGG24345.1 hypothetical protein DFA_06495 [Cavenderia fasciculata]|eukprot:XP_004362196.1 hypothetical protein DFA_06495 [Cavenderia fasciculata]